MWYLEGMYDYNKEWLGALVISSTLLFVAGVIGTGLKYMPLGPDALGFVRTMVAHNAYTSEASLRGNSAMDEMERARRCTA